MLDKKKKKNIYKITYSTDGLLRYYNTVDSWSADVECVYCSVFRFFVANTAVSEKCSSEKKLKKISKKVS